MKAWFENKTSSIINHRRKISESAQTQTSLFQMETVMEWAMLIVMDMLCPCQVKMNKGTKLE